jgi:hypothetical protein
MVASASKRDSKRTRENIRPLEPVDCEISPFHEADDACPWHGQTVVATWRKRTLEVVMPKVLPKKPPFPPDSTVIAITSFAYAGGTIHRGEKFHGDDPLVLSNPSWFADVNTPTAEVPNEFRLMPSPPEHRLSAAGFNIQPGPQPGTMVRSTCHQYVDAGFAPGTKKGISGFGTAVQKGQLVPITHPFVQKHPELFVWPERGVTTEDVEKALAANSQAGREAA